jgi:hypothetical protein
MANIESLIQGSERITNIFGYWPSFHDAEVLDLHFWRGHSDATKDLYDFPVLTLKIHLWELTKEVNSEGFLVLKHHTLATLRFANVEGDFEMHGFNHQNSILELSITSIERTKIPSPCFSVEIVPAFGMGASFHCSQIEVVDATPCEENGSMTR